MICCSKGLKDDNQVRLGQVWLGQVKKEGQDDRMKKNIRMKDKIGYKTELQAVVKDRRIMLGQVRSGENKRQDEGKKKAKDEGREGKQDKG